MGRGRGGCRLARRLRVCGRCCPTKNLPIEWEVPEGY
jgi:hypothetical protein